ncbi:MAG: porin family protein [Tenuifilaceae bacterium]
MRFFILLILLFNGIYFNSPAQNFDAGFIGGLAATQVDGDGYGGYDKAGPIAGVWVGRRINHTLYTRFELKYIQKGSYAKTTESGDYFRMRLNYFELPLLIGYRFGNGLNLLMGISGGYLARTSERNLYSYIPDEDLQKFRKFELAGKVGFEYNYSERWAFNAVFSYSILPIRTFNVTIPASWKKGQYNQVIELVARYKL